MSRSLLRSTSNGRHWLTTPTEPPLQIGPVARNHCRIGAYVLRRVGDALDELADNAESGEIEIPPRIHLEGEPGSPGVLVRLEFEPGPANWGKEDDEDDEDEPLFVTPLPPLEWQGSFDDWLLTTARGLGLEADPAAGPDGYEKAMAAAKAEVQRRLPGLRDRFLNNNDGLEIDFKIGIATARGGMEWVWILPTEWSDPDVLGATLHSEPHDCPGYKAGQVLRVPVTEIVDYTIGSRERGVVDHGLTDRIVQDYGGIFLTQAETA